jgi:hypothetical protein
MQRQLLKRSQNRINKSEASFVSTESLELISNLFWTIYNDDCSCSVVQMERWSVFLRIRDDQTHTAHCTQHTTIQFIQASINRNSTMVSTHIRSAEGRKTHKHTDGQDPNTPISKWRNAKDLGRPCCSGFKPAKSPQPYFITYNQSLFDYLQKNVSIIKFDPVLAFISQILASCWRFKDMQILHLKPNQMSPLKIIINLN